jgi:type IV secretory pathway VirD2 relaxase
MSDDEFEPRLGRLRARGSSRGRKYLGRVLAAAGRAGATTGIVRRSYDGSRIGRGASMGRLLASRDRHAGLRVRRVIVKTRLVKLGAKGLSGATAHMRYIQRDGVTREGAPGALYSAEHDQVDGQGFLDRHSGDRHQFRFIISAEDGSEYDDLKPMIRRLMAQAEQDLATRLDWVAVDHFNTGHPHTHIMLRGVDEDGRDLIIAREYIANGLRERAAEIVNLDLGPRTDLEIEARLRHDMVAERLTPIDRRLLRDVDADRIVVTSDRDPFQQSLRAGRLQKLGAMGLATPTGEGRWQLDNDLEATLRAMGERGDVIRTMQRDLTEAMQSRPGVDQRIFDPANEAAASIVGRILKRGFADEHRDRHYLLVDGVDGLTHYVDVGRGDIVEPTPEGTIVRVTARPIGIRAADQVIDAVARANDGVYSIDYHLRHDPTATQGFAETHVRRLEAMRRSNGDVEREPDGSWRIGVDHLDRAVAFERRQARDRPVGIEILSTTPIERMVRANAATWLDRALVGGPGGSVDAPVRDAGFGHDVRAAQAIRRQWLIDQGLADEQDGAVRYRANLLAILQRRELLRIAGQLSDELGLDFAEAKAGERIEGILKRRVDLTSGRFALIENAREFTLVPWRPALERQLGKPVGGIMREAGINWQVGRGRSGPTIS